jgi:amino acid transporter
MATARETAQADRTRADEARLAELGYKQELHRTWSGFSNFAISFSIISILAGCFTTFAQAWNNGGPIAISLGWPLISVFILIIGLCLAEMASAYPTAGGIYWWASRLGGPKAGFYTGWLNLIGLIAVTASVLYACASFLNITITLFWKGWADTFGGDALRQAFVLFLVLMALACVLNIFSSHLLALINNVSAGWHVLGAAVIIVVLLVASKGHQDLGFIFTERINNSGFSNNAFSFWFYVLPLGFLLTQYTITGFDASAHMSEETAGASRTVARGIWTSIFYSAIGGWLLLLAFLWAAKDVGFINSPDNGYGVGSVIAIFASSLSPALFKLVMIITTAGQVFCGIAAMTSLSRMGYAFSRDGAIPGRSIWSKVSPKTGVPVNAVLGGAFVGVLVTLPALYKSPAGIPVAFYAVVSVAVIGLYLAFLIPIWYRLKAGSSFSPGPWSLGRHYRWMNILSVAEITIISIYFCLPIVPGGVPFTAKFSWFDVNYAPIVTGAVLLAITIWWSVSAKKWFTGPRRTIEETLPDQLLT